MHASAYMHTYMQIHAVRTQLAAVEATLHSSGHKKIQCTEEGARSLEKLYGLKGEISLLDIYLDRFFQPLLSNRHR